MENMKPKHRGPNKMTKEMLARIETFVAARGLYPQPCGAPIAELCREYEAVFQSEYAVVEQKSGICGPAYTCP